MVAHETVTWVLQGSSDAAESKAQSDMETDACMVSTLRRQRQVDDRFRPTWATLAASVSK